ncbi:MAG: hypothetical protein ABI761_13515 [Saprospiraceae bacterium]
MIHSKNKTSVKSVFNYATWSFLLILLTVKPMAQRATIDVYRIIQKGGDTTIVCSLPVYKPSINQITSSPNNSIVPKRIIKDKTNK